MNIIFSILDPVDYSEYYIGFYPKNTINITRTTYIYADFLEQIELYFSMIPGKFGFPQEQISGILITGNIVSIIPLYTTHPTFIYEDDICIIQFDTTQRLNTDIRIISNDLINFNFSKLDNILISISGPRSLMNIPHKNITSL